MEPAPDQVAPAEWSYWTDEQRYLYLERVGMGASHAVAVAQARKSGPPPPQSRLF